MSAQFQSELRFFGRIAAVEVAEPYGQQHSLPSTSRGARPVCQSSVVINNKPVSVDMAHCWRSILVVAHLSFGSGLKYHCHRSLHSRI